MSGNYLTIIPRTRISAGMTLIMSKRDNGHSYIGLGEYYTSLMSDGISDKFHADRIRYRDSSN